MLNPDLAPTLKLLGGAVILVGDAPLGGPAAHRHRLALLALLATTGRVMSRDKLVAYLWPERDTESARNLLKTAVHELRKTLGEHVIRTTGDQLSTDPALLRCDVTEFDAAVEVGDLERAAKLYAGPFLDGFFLKESHEFEEWAEAQRVRLAKAQERVVQELTANPTLGSHVSAVAPNAPFPSPRSGRQRALTVALVTATAAALVVGGRGVLRSSAGASGLTPVILADSLVGSALTFDGTTANVSTKLGAPVTTQTDNISFDLLLRYDGPIQKSYQMIVCNGHGGVTGWGLMVLGHQDNQEDGTIGVLAGGITVVATSLVLKPRTWQRLTAERRDGRVTVTLDDKSFAVGAFPVAPMAGKYRQIERTTVGGDGTYDEPTGFFRGAIDRFRIRDLQSNYFVDRWNFDEGKGTMTVGDKGTPLYLGRTQWSAAERLAPRDLFWRRMEQICGQSYPGRLTQAFAEDTVRFGRPLILHMSGCQPNEIRMSLHVGTDRSRTWVLSRTLSSLHFRQEDRGPDGALYTNTNYGGDAQQPGSFSQQDFPADRRSATQVPTGGKTLWTIEIVPGDRLAYYLHGTERPVRIEFDLKGTVAKPPPAWGAAP